MNLEQTVAIVTGASRGIGKSTALLLARNKVKVVLVARNKADLADVENQIVEEYGSAIAIEADVSKEFDVSRVLGKTFDKFGRIDILVNNAGVGYFKTIEDLTVDEYDQMMNVNVKGTFLFSKAVIPHMKDRGTGHIVIVASDAARRSFCNGSLYCASKAAQDAMAGVIRLEGKTHGIKVSTVYPGLTDTYFGTDPQGADLKKDWLKANDVASAVLYAVQAPPYAVVDEIVLHPTCQEY